MEKKLELLKLLNELSDEEKQQLLNLLQQQQQQIPQMQMQMQQQPLVLMDMSIIQNAIATAIQYNAIANAQMSQMYILAMILQAFQPQFPWAPPWMPRRSR